MQADVKLIVRRFWQRLKSLLLSLREHALTVYFIARSPQTSLPLRLFALMVAAYAFSPIDLIPDFIPVLGLVDDLVLLPIGFALVLRFTPDSIQRVARTRSIAASEKPVSRIAALTIIGLWGVLLWLLATWLLI